MTKPTDFDAIEVLDSTRLGNARGIIITPTSDRAIRLKSFNRSELVNGVPSEIAVDLTPAAIVAALNKIPGFTVVYETPKPVAPTGLGAIVELVKDGQRYLFMNTDLDEDPWRATPPFQPAGSARKLHWLRPEQISDVLADGGSVLHGGVEL